MSGVNYILTDSKLNGPLIEEKKKKAPGKRANKLAGFVLKIYELEAARAVRQPCKLKNHACELMER